MSPRYDLYLPAVGLSGILRPPYLNVLMVRQASMNRVYVLAAFTLIMVLSACGADPARRLTKPCNVTFSGGGARPFLGAELQLEVLFDGLQIGEGPVWVPAQQRLLASNVAGNEMYSWSERDGASVLLDASGFTGFAPSYEGGVRGSNGAAIDANGDLIFCQHGDRRIAKMSLTGSSVGEIQTVVSRFKGKRFNSPNDLTIAPDGDIFFSDPPYGFLDKVNSDPTAGKMIFVKEKRELETAGIYRFRPSTGELSMLSDAMDLPNGMALSPDGAFLYVNSSDMQKREMWRFSTSDGSGAVFYDGPYGDDEKGWFDGLKMHASGNVFTTGPGGILVVSPAGERIATISLPDEATNICFDDDQSHLFVTTMAYVGRIALKP